MVSHRVWQGRTQSEADFLRIKGARTLNEDEQRVLRAVWAYRDGEAKAANRPSFKLIPDPFLLTLAKSKPQTEEEMGRLARKGSSMLRRHGASLLRAVAEGVEDDSPIPELPRTQRSKSVRSGPGVDRYLVPLKEWRNTKVKTSGVAPVAVANNSLLKEISRLAPTDVESLSQVPGIRQWQVRDFGEELLAVVKRVTEQGNPEGKSRPKRRRRRKPKSSE